MELQEEISPLLHKTVQGKINFIRKNLFEINNLKTLHGTFLLKFFFRAYIGTQCL